MESEFNAGRSREQIVSDGAFCRRHTPAAVSSVSLARFEHELQWKLDLLERRFSCWIRSNRPAIREQSLAALHKK